MRLPLYSRTKTQRYRLTGSLCPACGAFAFSPRLMCLRCGYHQEIAPASRPAPRALQLVSVPERPLLSVVVPAYNSGWTIRATLTALAQQDFRQRHEVIVVDSSSDDTPAIIAREFPSIRLIHRGQRTEPGAARNLGISAAQGEIIACLDSDCIVPAGWLSGMVACQQAGYSIVGGGLKNGNPTSLISWAGYFGEFREFLPVGSPRWVDHLPTCNISYHRSVFDRFGGFPSGVYPQEDLVYHWWLKQQGVRIWFDPTLSVEHLHRTTWPAYVQHSRRIGRVTAQVLRLTGLEGAWLANSPWLSTLAAPALPFIKWARTVAVLLQQQPQLVREHPLALAPLLAGLCVWAWGFAEGARIAPIRSSHQAIAFEGS